MDPLAYIGTPDFMKALYLELSGLLIEILLLILLFPMLWKILTLPSTLRARSMLFFYILQIHHRFLDILMNILEIPSVSQFLREHNSTATIQTHWKYGNFENKIEALTISLNSRSRFNIDALIKAIPQTRIDEYIAETNALLSEIDRLLLIASRHAKAHHYLFESRRLIYAFRGILKNFRTDIFIGHPDPLLNLYGSFKNVLIDYRDDASKIFLPIKKYYDRMHILSHIPLGIGIIFVYPFFLIGNLIKKIKERFPR